MILLMYSGPGFGYATGGYFIFFIFWLSAPDKKLLCMRKTKDFKTSGFYDNAVSKEDEMTTSNTGCADPLGTKLLLRAVHRYWAMGDMRHTPPFSNGDGDFQFPVILPYFRHWRFQAGEIQQFVEYSKTSLTSASLVKKLG